VELEHQTAVRNPRPVRRIQPTRGLSGFDFAELWRRKELLYYLIARDIKARYKQTFLGAFWAIFRPFVQAMMLFVIFGKVAKIQTGDRPQQLFFLAGTLVWGYFSSTLSGGAGSVLNSAGIVSKAYFPRLFVPLAAVTAPLVDFVLSLTVAVGFFLWFGFVPGWHIVFAPFFILMSLLMGFGVSLWLAPITIRFRDLGFALPFVMQIWMYATPVIYPPSLAHGKLRLLIDVNPMTGVVEGFKWALIKEPPPNTISLAVTFAATIVIVVGGIFHFKRAERTFVDVL
jgi:lipopolysaccharide transport system permease protein